MISRLSLTKRAVSAIMAGIAFFLLGCVPKIVPPKPPPESTLPDYFALADQELRKKNDARALVYFERFLKENPEDERSGRAMYRLANIYSRQTQFDKALNLYRKITRDYPDHPEIPVVKYDIAMMHYRLGDYQQSTAVELEWLDNYPGHSLKGEILILLGKNSRALKNNSTTFEWWIKAAAEFDPSSERSKQLSQDIEELIKQSPIEELTVMLAHAQKSEYMPNILYQTATLYLIENDLLRAREAAAALVRSTPQQSWVNLGRKILEEVEIKLTAGEKVIGCLLPLSGPFSIYGQEILNGIQLALGIVDPTVGGPSLQLIIKDTGGKAQSAVAAVEELANEENVLGIIGPLFSKPSLAAAGRAQELGIPIITLTQKEGITREGDMVFRNFLTPSNQIKSLLDEVIGDLGIKRMAIFYPNTAYGRFFMNLFWDKAEEMGGMMRAVESYEPDETDYTAQIKKMVGLYYPRPQSTIAMLERLKLLEAEELVDDDDEENPEADKEPEPIVDFDAVFIPDNHRHVALIAPQFPFHNVFGVRLLGTALWQSPELIEQASDYVQGAVFPTGFFASSGSLLVRAFVELYQENFETEPGDLAANGFDTMNFLKGILYQPGVITRADLQKRLPEHEYLNGVTGRISFDLQGEVEKDPILLTIAGRRFRVVP
ncbi:penicillin-binding protein activator [Thermodesulfobacteriota bacterium]